MHKTPIRTCVGCQQTHSKRAIVRFVRTPAGVVELDLSNKAAGRGAYVCAEMDCFDTAVKRRAFERALKVTLDIDDYDRLRAQFCATVVDNAAVGKESN